MPYNADWKQTPGPWQGEPDKELWKDPESGFTCLTWRNHSGVWCGYVELPENHPLYGIEYSDPVPPSCQHAAEEIMQGPAGKRGAISIFCMAGRGPMAGDLFDVHGSITFSGAREHGGFWYGFDCGHSGDYTPALEFTFDDGEYRTLEYTKAECASLAKQLMALMPKQLTYQENPK